MSSLSIYRSQLQRERDEAVKVQRSLADISDKIKRKRDEFGRAKTSSRQQTLQRELGRLMGQRVNAEKTLAARQRKINDLESKVLREQRLEDERTKRRQQEATREQERSRRSLESTLAATTFTIDDLRTRVVGLESALLERVRDAVATDPVSREHDVFLSHAGPDKEVAGELYKELTARGLDVWFDGAELRLGESLTRQIDRGIAHSRLGVILITSAFLTGRYWTEREMGALISSRRRVIPVLDGVTFDDLSRYSPLLSDLVGLTTERDGLDDIAEQIGATLVDIGHS